MEEPINCQDSAIGFCCFDLPRRDGFTYTLTSILGKLLHAAEEQFGARDRSWTILGIEFRKEGGPNVWFPGPGRNVVIQLSYAGRENTNRAQFELAQEIVHLLAPNAGGPANVFEEGVATLFAHQQHSWRVTEKFYLDAENLVKPLVAADPQAIRKLRSIRPNFFDFTPGFIRENYPDVSRPDANALCARFQQ